MHIKHIVVDSNYISDKLEDCNCDRRIYKGKMKSDEANILEEKQDGKEIVFTCVAKSPTWI